MKKLIVVLVALIFAAPALATVTITCTADPCCSGQVTVSYATDGNNIRAIGLDISADDANIVEVGDVNPAYYIHPGSFDVEDGNIVGDVVADAGEYPGTQPGLGSGAITIEMGSAYVGEANAPDASGVLLTFKVDGDCNITLAENAIRGGIVMEDPDEEPAVVLNGCAVCYTPPGPACWNCPNGYVNAADVVPIINALNQPASVNPCADLNKSGYINAADVVPIINNLLAGDGVPCP